MVFFKNFNVDPARRQIFGNASAEKCIPVLRVCHRFAYDQSKFSKKSSRNRRKGADISLHHKLFLTTIEHATDVVDEGLLASQMILEDSLLC